MVPKVDNGGKRVEIYGKEQTITGLFCECILSTAGNAVKQTKFKPGKQRGKPVNVQVSIPVVFKLQ